MERTLSRTRRPPLPDPHPLNRTHVSLPFAAAAWPTVGSLHAQSALAALGATDRSEAALWAAATILGIALAITLWAFLRQRSLRRSLAGQTALLAEQRALLQALYDNIPTAMTVLERSGADFRLISLNRQAGSLYQIEPAEAAGRLLGERSLPPFAAEHFQAMTRNWPEEGRIRHDEVRFEGNRRILAVTLVPLTSANRGPARMCILAEDITTRRQMDEEIAQTRKLRAVGELVGGIAHEFNNLLTFACWWRSLPLGDFLTYRGRFAGVIDAGVASSFLLKLTHFRSPDDSI